MTNLFPYEYSFAGEKQIARLQNLGLLEQQISDLQFEADSIIRRYGKLKNNADSLDYMVAFASGAIAGAIDIIWVGAFDFNRGKQWGSEKVNDFVQKVAKWQGYKGDKLDGAIKFLEDKFPIVADKATAEFGGGLGHHLRDFSHHPTPIGLMFSLLTQFTGNVYGTDTTGAFMIVPLKDTTLIGKDIYEKILFGVVYWFFHMVSDMAGSSGTAGGGTGLPGPIVSLLKEISSLPIFQNFKNESGNSEFSVFISKLFNGTLFSKRDENGKIIKESIKPFDLRGEIGVAYELSRQALPVIINECVVRAFYFIRRFAMEIREQKISNFNDLKYIDWQVVLPFNNGTIKRMLSISSATFTAIDLADAYKQANILRVNFIGIARLCLAVLDDLKFHAKLAKQYRADMERICGKIIELLQIYESELRSYINEYLSDHIAEFDKAFSCMSDMYKLGDINGFIKNANLLTQNLGGETQFKNFDEFNALIEKGEIITI
ncbi:hypothetical protein OFO03_03845 [Campylobacter sp. JMF_02 ED1]|uniref:hypothetical protein n=1 Tax=unclassified Campylobacter TaxID=2593542 RepID=UPI0022E9B0AA|nr:MULTISPECIES: hypothetical protein [unclassified Campylobacter]MDA3049546.1 hypothetical protein [Campylobacter sp. JMF_15 NE4]MDA3051027.1 hypothetical protein [Campylobacter sp. JMF_02 ED1]